MDTAKRTILLADDHALFRSGMKYLLKQLDGNIETLEAANYPDAITVARDVSKLDLALVDLSMPGLNNFKGLRHLHSELGAVPFVVVSALDRGPEIRQAMACGASGYIPKTLEPRIVLNALKLVFSGGVYLPPNLMQENRLSNPAEPWQTDGKSARLTPRQGDVLALIARGYSNREIASELKLAEGTIKLHVTALLKVLDVNNRTQAVIKADSLGLTSRVTPENSIVI